MILFLFCFGVVVFFCREKRGNRVSLVSTWVTSASRGAVRATARWIARVGKLAILLCGVLAVSGALGRSRAGRMKSCCLQGASLLRLLKSLRICGRGGVPLGEEA